jgi:hypothetical protein
MKFLDWLFGGPSSQKPPIRNPADPELYMVGEPVISFVKCLKSDPKRFKLTYHTQAYAKESGFWGEIYHWMCKDSTYTGYVKLLDRKEGDEYYGVVHKGGLYSVRGLKFNLNGWEGTYIMKAFQSFRKKAIDRKNAMISSKMKQYRLQEDHKEKLEREKLMEKFQ